MTSNRSLWALIIHVLQKEGRSNRMSEAANKETMIAVNDEHRMMAVELAKRQLIDVMWKISLKSDIGLQRTLIQMTQAVRRNDLETYQRLDC